MKDKNYSLRILEFIKGNYSDKEFFTSKKFKERVSSLARIVTNRYKSNKNYVPITTALKVIGSQSAYQMCEYNESVFLSDYNTYESVDIMLKDIEYAHGDKYYHLGDTTTPWCYYNGESPEYCFNKYNSYWEIINTQLLQIEEDINDIGMNDMYLSAVELDYLGIVYPDRFKIVRFNCDDWETYAIKDTKTDEYIVDANGDYINGYFTDINTVATDLNVGGWY